ncbi:DUF4332 domain-containing protein [Denitrobaculum tricleocarpae]|uniref:DUF4332 domain-containing protein n=1 Tax=Denitrobaculum tricleocarpae TaxID=2591009 RepID=A0A545TY25_9PROT|nr:DUF4332 domain-containing protein [Denitrobaculum tricleocarpae]TQV82125.1 DUF4332 domain-containing protein [Denitrobaculum tricleocarpae]
MICKIEEIEGIGGVYREKLSAAGIDTTDSLLQACGTPAGRKALAETSEISEKMLLTWANMADLMRINGVGKQFAELLEAAGVDTVKELKHRNAANLAEKMTEINEQKSLTNGAVSEGQVSGWIEQAKTMDPAISY